MAGGFMMLADVDTKRDPAILTAGKIGSGGATLSAAAWKLAEPRLAPRE